MAATVECISRLSGAGRIYDPLRSPFVNGFRKAHNIGHWCGRSKGISRRVKTTNVIGSEGVGACGAIEGHDIKQSPSVSKVQLSCYRSKWQCRSATAIRVAASGVLINRHRRSEAQNGVKSPECGEKERCPYSPFNGGLPPRHFVGDYQACWV